MTPPNDARRGDAVLVIGAGPAGLSVGAALTPRGIPFEIVEAGPSVGGIWDIDRPETPMYESAHFISSKTRSAFAGFPMPDDYPDYPRHDRILAYVRAFARARGLERRVTLDTRVTAVRPLDDGVGWRVTLESGEEREYGAVVAATGLAWHPRLPEVPGRFLGEARHSFAYRSPEEFRGRRVLVVGAGNSGCDLACDAARVAERAFLSLRRGYHFIPKYVFGRPADVFAHEGPRMPAWLERRVFGFLIRRILVGDLTRYGLPAPDHPILASHPILNTQVLHHLGHGDLEARPDVAELRDRSVVFTDGTEEEVDLIVWATGYRRTFPFLERDPADPYLNLFDRERPSLSFPGLFETDGASYGLFSLQARLIAASLEAMRADDPSARAFRARARSDHPDLRAGRSYLGTARHRLYVQADAYRRVLEREGARLKRVSAGHR